mmetsp:Transcript_19720/g.42853  ORF Transcript_19720/g.42853 Transcript_19720/m.42853 type:complete len:98 (-) Transcript_19720:488-781(-)|eukprot:CAMPEP_0168192804 /NCGR_PEP_ID=MMETSP0139_2-20121125/18245_1 /TAXON_ID=44445 /ORGANISM="Pseudo-nitzschia australis, Strain 10249 10 AB" /LENGTH=97 /DNA_ID=CAMNT_0008116071 /DNA_START=118 /DNA_END=411 /DNA_ORIENTATION=+
MVYRGRRSSNRDRYEEENEEEEEVDQNSNPGAVEVAKIQEAHFLAQQALRMAKEAREAAMRVREYKARISSPYRRGNMIEMDDISTLREENVSPRSQ